MKTAPIILFVYNRPEHTRRTVESLAKNELAGESELFIFSDAPKDEESVLRVEQVREYIDTLETKNKFKSVTIYKVASNKGLADSIIDGVTKVIEQYGCCIVLEDDLLSAPDFLTFMNEALVFYKDIEKIGSISGYSPLQTLPNHYHESIWTASRSSSLGWGTWLDRWKDIDWEVKDFETFKEDKQARKRMDECGSDQYDRLRRQIEDGADSWAVRFSYWQVKANKNTVFPSVTRIQHIGWDGSGVHGTYSGPLDTHVKKHSIPFVLKNIQPDLEIISMLKTVYSGTLLGQISKYLRNNGFEKLESYIRKVMGK